MMSGNLRAIAKRLAPESILQLRKRRMWAQIRQQYSQLSVSEAFKNTYQRKLWGSVEGEEYFSGIGSLEEFSAPYTNWLISFIKRQQINRIVDLGCGDFRVGRQICSAVSVNYVGVDIVPDLITYNQSRFGSQNVSFKCVDIIEDELPEGDLCLIRQVLQHLSNKQISQVLTNCGKFPYLVVTEDVYSGPNMRLNLDITHGPDNRLFRRSGVFLDQPPFSLRTQNVVQIPCPEFNSVIRTCLIEGKHNRPHTGDA
jgi:SAM-dependent methyltransferase